MRWNLTSGEAATTIGRHYWEPNHCSYGAYGQKGDILCRPSIERPTIAGGLQPRFHEVHRSGAQCVPSPTCARTCGDKKEKKNRQKNNANDNWIEQQMREALATVDDGMAVRTAGRQYEIPSSILQSHVYGTTMYRRRGRKGTLTNVEEE